MKKLSLTFAMIFSLVLVIGTQVYATQAHPVQEADPVEAPRKGTFDHSGYLFEVTITNVTHGQIITPPLLFSHSADFELFTLGDPAPPEVAALAEDGDVMPLMELLGHTPEFYDYDLSSSPVLPGESVTLQVMANGYFRNFTVAGMLATTNDAFFAVNNTPFPNSTRKLTIEGIAYDAGSEANSESCAYIPGPPCENSKVRDIGLAEGFVYVHSGIHGNMDLDSELYDWQNPVAIVTVQRVVQPLGDFDEE